MDFDDHDEPEEEIGLPVSSTYDTPRGGKIEAACGSSNRKVSGGGATGGGKYRECLKNHAVSIGGHAVDGCGEFMAAGEEGTLDALRCAACNCHRNFHRKEAEGSSGGLAASATACAPEGYHHQFSPYYRTPAGYLHHHHHLMAAAAAHQRAPPPLALPSTSGGGGQSREDQDDMSDPMAVGGVGAGAGASGSGGKKRFRTKFTQEQKDKMLAFAERVGWRIQKHDEAAVQQFCNETAVKRHVLKVWMHNNKHTLGKKP